MYLANIRQVYSSDCNGTIKSGETKNCIITNKYDPFIPGLLSKLIVTKKVINQGGGTNKPSDFTISVSGTIHHQHHFLEVHLVQQYN